MLFGVSGLLLLLLGVVLSPPLCLLLLPAAPARLACLLQPYLPCLLQLYLLTCLLLPATAWL